MRRKNIPFQDVKNLYMLSYDSGCKGVTYMRDGSRQGVLERIDDKKEKAEKASGSPGCGSGYPEADHG